MVEGISKLAQNALRANSGGTEMHDLRWSASEKKIARRVFETALQQELSEVMSKFKEMAAHAQEPDDMWAVEGWLSRQRRDIEAKYDFRYSQLVGVFGRLLREGRVTEEQLAGLAEDKLSYIERVASL